MTKYYKGKLFNKNAINTTSTNILVANNMIAYLNDNRFNGKFKSLTDEERKIIDEFFSNLENSNIEIDNNLKIILKKILPEFNICNNTLDIIYELIEDEDGNYYGKELITGNIFPIAFNKDIVINYPIDNSKMEVYTDFSRNMIINTQNNLKRNDSFYDQFKREFIYNKLFDENNYQLIEYSEKAIAKNKHIRTVGYFKKVNGTLFKVYNTYNIIFSNLERGEYYIENDTIANNIEINKYQRKYKDSFMNQKRKKFIDYLNDCANKNVYKKEIIPKKEEKELLEKDDLTKIMERISCHLLRLKDYSEPCYNKYNNIFNELIQQDENQLKIPITKTGLESLEAAIMMCFKFDKKSGNNILSYLEYKKMEYFDNLFNNNKNTSLSINDIDKIMELYLKMQKEFEISKRRVITLNISLLYLLELIINKEEIDMINLSKSYFKDNTLSILFWIYTLSKNNIIKTDMILDLAFDYELNDVINIIRNIEVKEKDMEKVKKIV